MSKCFDPVKVKETMEQVRKAMSGVGYKNTLENYNNDIGDVTLPLPK